MLPKEDEEEVPLATDSAVSVWIVGVSGGGVSVALDSLVVVAEYLAAVAVAKNWR